MTTGVDRDKPHVAELGTADPTSKEAKHERTSAIGSSNPKAVTTRKRKLAIWRGY